METNLRTQESINVIKLEEEDVLSYHTTKLPKVSSQARKLHHIPTRTTSDKLLRARNLALSREGKMKGAFQRVIDEALEIGLSALENKQKHSTSFAISGKSKYRSDVIDRLEQIKRKFKEWEYTGKTFPVFHVNTIVKMIKEVLPQGADHRTVKKYRDIIFPICKEAVDDNGEVLTSQFDVTHFLKHQFLRGTK
tara:strand:- start:6043 stop:6624 length:582 start_codon:yes stop_codon:yes gene_type:complete